MPSPKSTWMSVLWTSPWKTTPEEGGLARGCCVSRAGAYQSPRLRDMAASVPSWEPVSVRWVPWDIPWKIGVSKSERHQLPKVLSFGKLFISSNLIFISSEGFVYSLIIHMNKRFPHTVLKIQPTWHCQGSLPICSGSPNFCLYFWFPNCVGGRTGGTLPYTLHDPGLSPIIIDI